MHRLIDRIPDYPAAGWQYETRSDFREIVGDLSLLEVCFLLLPRLFFQCVPMWTVGHYPQIVSSNLGTAGSVRCRTSRSVPTTALIQQRRANADAIYYKDETELASLIRTKQLSSREVVQAHLDRIAAINPKINAIVTLLAEDALKAADAADAVVKNGAKLGPLHGVPFTIKDSIDTAGVLTQRGSKIFSGNIPEKDATVVTRFKAACAIPFAKTNLPEFSVWQETDNLVTGLTKNPWNVERTPDGSSGGESAAIAAGLSPVGIGSDVAISIRGPAALTGIVGLKATHGRIPYTGH